MASQGNGLGRAADVGHLHDQALACLTSARFSEAESLCIRALAMEPRHVGLLNLLGQALLKLGRPADAARAFAEAIDAEPNLANLHFNFALALQADARCAEAIHALQMAIELDPKVPILYAKLGQLLCTMGANSEALPILRRAVELDPKSTSARINLAQALSDAGDAIEAEKVVRAAIFLNPNDGDAHRLLGRINQLNGRMREAAECFAEALRLQPERSAPYFALVYSRRITEEDRPLLGKMERLRSVCKMADADLGILDYALGKACDDLGLYDQAIEHFHRANAVALNDLLSTGRRFDRVQEEADVDRRIEAFTRARFTSRSSQCSSSDRPVFIVGMIRSGTTLIEQILSSHPEIDAAGELSYWMAYDRMWLDGTAPGIDEAVSRYMSLLDGLSHGTPRVTDKMPLNYLALGSIHEAFPNARIVRCRRHPVDTCLSAYVTPYRGSPVFGHDLRNIASAYRAYQRLMEHWRAVIPSSNLLEVDYEDVVADREARAREIVEFVGLTWDPACLDPEANKRFVNTPSLWQVRQPVYRTSIQRWKNYERHLGPLQDLMP